MQAIFLIFMLFSLSAAAFDIKKGAVPRILFVVYEAVFFAVLFVLNRRMIPRAATGGIYALAMFSAVRLLGRKRMGKADIWYALAGAEVLSFFAWHIAMMTACCSAALYIAVSGEKKIPFIPFMSLGCISMILIKKI